MRKLGRSVSGAQPAQKTTSAPMVRTILMVPRGYRGDGPCAEPTDVLCSQAMAANLFQILSDCPDCRVASAVLELIDPGKAGGVTLAAACRLCGRHVQIGEVVQTGASLREPAAARAAITAWAAAESEPDPEAFCRHNLGGLGLEEVVQRLGTGQSLIHL